MRLLPWMPLKIEKVCAAQWSHLFRTRYRCTFGKSFVNHEDGDKNIHQGPKHLAYNVDPIFCCRGRVQNPPVATIMQNKPTTWPKISRKVVSLQEHTQTRTHAIPKAHENSFNVHWKAPAFRLSTALRRISFKHNSRVIADSATFNLFFALPYIATHFLFMQLLR